MDSIHSSQLELIESLNLKTFNPSLPLTLRMLLPTSAIGLLIGKKGKTMEQISRITGVDISFQPFHDIRKNSTERGVILKGTFDKIAISQSIIIEKLKFKRPNVDVTTADDDLVEQFDGSYMLKYVIPKKNCGLLIGRKGAGIKTIYEQCGAWVKVAHLHEIYQGPDERIIYITGDADQVIQASEIVFSKVGGRRYSSAGSKINGESTQCVLKIPFLAAEYFMNERVESLQEVYKNTGAELELVSRADLEVGDKHTVLYIRGNEEARENAKLQCQALLDEWKSAMNEELLNEEHIIMRIQLPFEVATIFGTAQFKSKFEKATTVLINYLQNFPSPSISTNERIIVITGTLPSIICAEQIMMMMINHHKGSSPIVPQNALGSYIDEMPDLHSYEYPDYSNQPSSTDDSSNQYGAISATNLGSKISEYSEHRLKPDLDTILKSLDVLPFTDIPQRQNPNPSNWNPRQLPLSAAAAASSLASSANKYQSITSGGGASVGYYVATPTPSLTTFQTDFTNSPRRVTAQSQSARAVTSPPSNQNSYSRFSRPQQVDSYFKDDFIADSFINHNLQGSPYAPSVRDERQGDPRRGSNQQQYDMLPQRGVSQLHTTGGGSLLTPRGIPFRAPRGIPQSGRSNTDQFDLLNQLDQYQQLKGWNLATDNAALFPNPPPPYHPSHSANLSLQDGRLLNYNNNNSTTLSNSNQRQQQSLLPPDRNIMLSQQQHVQRQWLVAQDRLTLQQQKSPKHPDDNKYFE